MYTSLDKIEAVSEAADGTIKNLTITKNQLTADLLLKDVQYQIKGVF